MNVADAMTAIASTLRPGRSAALRRPSRDDRRASRAVDQAVRGAPAAARRDRQRPATSSDAPAPKNAPVAIERAGGARRHQRDAEDARSRSPRDRPSADAPDRRYGGLRRPVDSPGQQTPLRHAREPAQRPPDADHRRDERADRAGQQRRPATRAASAPSCRPRRPTRSAGRPSSAPRTRPRRRCR